MIINDWFVGIVEDVNDPNGQGRVRVRCLGYHTPDRNDLPTGDLPLATVMLPTTSASAFGIGSSATSLIPNSWVFGFFRDGTELQDPVIVGTIASASGYDVGYDVTTNYGFGDPHKTFSSFIGNDIPPEAGTLSSLNGGSVANCLGAANTYNNIYTNTGYSLTTTFDQGSNNEILNGDASKLIIIARSQIRIKETSDNRGPGIEKYWSACDYNGYGSRWCAAFVCWVIQQSNILSDKERPKNANAFGFIDWSKGKKYAQLRQNPRFVKAGDIVIFSYSHVGIASTDSDENGNFKDVGGNTSNGVYEKTRNIKTLKAAITLTNSYE